MRLKIYNERANGDLWRLAYEYLGAFAQEFGYTPDQTFNVPRSALVNLTMLIDDIADQRQRSMSQTKDQVNPGYRKMTR